MMRMNAPRHRWWPAYLAQAAHNLDLNAVFGDPNHGFIWAIGDGGTILRLREESWAQERHPLQGALTCGLYAPGRALVIGGKVAVTSHIEARGPGPWTEIPLPPLRGAVSALARGADGKLLLGTKAGKLYKVEGPTAWEIPLPGPADTIRAIVDQEILVVVMSDRTIYRDLTGEWHDVQLPPGRGADSPHARFNAAWGDGVGTIWLAGDHGLIASWRHGEWWKISMARGTRDNFAVHGSSPGDVWVVGDSGVISRWNGTDWKPSTSRLDVPLYAVWASQDRVVAVGADQSILEFRR